MKDGQRISFIEWYITFLDMEIDDLEAQIDSGTDNCLLDRTFVAFFDGR